MREGSLDRRFAWPYRWGARDEVANAQDAATHRLAPGDGPRATVELVDALPARPKSIDPRASTAFRALWLAESGFDVETW